MDSLEISAKTVEEAIQQALEQLGIRREEAEITVLKEGRSGLFGLGSEEARVRVTPLQSAALPSEAEVARLAQEVLEKLVTAMGVTATVSVKPEPKVEGEDITPVSLNIEGDDLGILIGRRGQTLTDLQYVVRLIVAHQLRSGQARVRLPITIDVEGYKEHRYEALKNMALRMADQVRGNKTPFTLEPMTPFERRIIHLALVDNPDVTTYSIGEGESRKVVIAPKDKLLRSANRRRQP